jgi:hypothetical protein
MCIIGYPKANVGLLHAYCDLQAKGVIVTERLHAKEAGQASDARSSSYACIAPRRPKKPERNGASRSLKKAVRG